MSKATKNARNPDAPYGYERPKRLKDSISIEAMEKAYIGDMYLPYFAMMADSPFFTDPNIEISSDFELNSSDEEKEAEIEDCSQPENHEKDIEEINILKESNKEETGDKSETAIKIITSKLDESKRRNETKEKSRKGSKKDKKKAEEPSSPIVVIIEDSEEEPQICPGKDDAPQRNIKGDHSKGKKRKHSNLDKNADDQDDSSDSESNISYSEDGHRRRRRKQYSRSPSPVIIPDTRTDFYNCDVCHVTLKYYTQYQTHLSGMRHRKNLQVRNVNLGIVSSFNLIDPNVEQFKPDVFGIKKGPNSNSNYAVSMRDMPSTSSQRFDNIPADHYHSYQSDTSKSDFYCKTCECTMNGIATWESHIKGQRHLTMLQMEPVAMPSRTISVHDPKKTANLLERLNDEVLPIVGLDHIQETQIPETCSETYNCFLCGTCVTSLDIMEHLLSMKHRRKYLEHIQHPGISVINSIRDPYEAYYATHEMCKEIEATEGRGTPSVHVTKNFGIL